VSTTLEQAEDSTDGNAVSPWLIALLAITCGLIAGNLYYAQPIAGPIGAAVGLSPEATGLVVTMAQIGYGMGLLLVVPLGDLIENRRLTLILIGITTLAALGVALSARPVPLLLSTALIGIGSVAVQVLVPYAAHMAPAAVRGRVVGSVMSGLMFGVMLARPVSSFITHLFSWHVVFFCSAGVMLVLALVLARVLPERRPRSQLRYGELLASMWELVRTTPTLRRKALYQAALFGAFSLFWTTTPLLLSGPTFRLSQGEIGLFALAGITGAVAMPIVGWMADRGWSRPITCVAMLTAVIAFLVTRLDHPGSTLSLGLLVAAAVLVDFGNSANAIVSQRAIFSLGAQYRARLNGLYMTTFFTGGAIGSAVGGWSYAYGGWNLTSWIGLGLPLAALAYFLTERSTPQTHQ
jgi:predicted MFS family arabinose efflux permease